MQSVRLIEQSEEKLKKLRDSPFYKEGNPFRMIRKAFAFTQSDAAFRVGVSRSLWLAWEQKDRPITVLQLESVVRCFGLAREEVEWIVTWWGDSRASVVTVAQLNELESKVEAVSTVDALYEIWGIPQS